MKKFLSYILIFSAPVIILISVTEVLIRSIPNEYSIKKDYLDRNSNEIEILILGSSHTLRGVDPKYMNYKAYNAAMVSQSIDYDLEILKKYEGNWDSLKAIVLPISYFSLYSNLENEVESWRVKNYNIYFDIFKGNERKYYTEVLNSPFKDNVKRISKYYLSSDPSTLTISELGWDYKKALLEPNKMEESGRLAAERHTEDSNALFNTNMKILNEILILANKNCWNVIFVTPPAYHSYRRYLDKMQLNATIEAVTQIDSLFNNVKYYNLIESSHFQREDYYDADHLNGRGSVKFSKLLNEFVNNVSQY